MTMKRNEIKNKCLKICLRPEFDSLYEYKKDKRTTGKRDF